MSLLLKNRPNGGPKFAVKRLLKRGRIWICGMCRNEYKKKISSEKCLKRCIEVSLQQAGTYPVSTKFGWKHKCSICNRIYDDKNMADKCVAQCKKDYSLRQKNSDKAAERPRLGADGKPAKIEELKRKPAIQKASPPAKKEAANVKPGKIAKTAKTAKTAKIDKIDKKAKDKLPPLQAANKAPLTTTESQNQHKYGKDGKIIYCKNCGEEHVNILGAIACYDSHESEAIESHDLLASKKDAEIFEKTPSGFICRKCKQSYKVRNEVISCYQTHLKEEFRSHSKKGVEAIDTRQNAKSAAKNTDKFKRDGAKYLCGDCGQKFFTKLEVLECYNSHQGKSLKKEASPQKNIKSIKAKNEADKYKRDGAKYICKACSGKFFTKMEVVACFDSH